MTRGLPAVAPIDPAWVARAAARQRTLTKPPGSLGRLETVANRVAAIQETLTPDVAARRIVVFAADHGVVAERVSPWPPSVTAQMVENMRRGGAAVNALARAAGASLTVVDVGVAAPIAPGGGLVGRRIRAGTANSARGPAMTRKDARAALRVGVELADRAAAAGVRMIGLGEMGIGNSTAAAAVTAALTGRPAAAVTGRGTGVDDAMLARKVRVVERALRVNRPDADDPLDVLRTVGGLELGALCGLTLGAAARRLVVVTDGFIATAGAALAVRLRPAAGGYLVAAHRSPEPGHAALLAALGARPLLDLELRLGEGTGAAAAFPLIAAAVAALREMATFESAGVATRPARDGGGGLPRGMTR